jgi:hypothetical protein
MNTNGTPTAKPIAAKNPKIAKRAQTAKRREPYVFLDHYYLYHLFVPVKFGVMDHVE